MLKVLKIFLVFYFCVPLSYAGPGNFKIAYPSYIPEGNSFQISLLTHKEFPTAEVLEIYLMPGDFLNLDKAELRFDGGTGILETNLIFLEDYSKYAYKCVIDLTLPPLEPTENFFQVLLKFTGSSLLNSTVELFGVFKEREFVLGYLQSSDPAIETENSNVYKVDLNFYTPVNTAGQVIQLEKNSNVYIPLSIDVENNLLAEFWIKLNGPVNEFLSIENNFTGRELYSLSVNEYQVLNVNSEFLLQKNLSPHFLSDNVWYHISVLIFSNEGHADFYCNGMQFAKMSLPQILEVEDLELKFENNSESAVYSIDQLRVYDLLGNAESTFKNRSFANAGSDSAKVILQLNFAQDEMNSLLNSSILKFENLKYIRSDAPIFHRAPELNLRIMNNFYELEWSGGDYKSAENYIVEKAEGNNNFIEIYETVADSRENKVYTYLSEKVNLSEVVYFRIKQLNKDESEVSSAPVKVGQGVMEDVILGQNFPNPFNPVTRIEFELLLDSEVEVKVYNLEGKEVALLHKGFLSRGTYQYEFDGSELPSGIYLYKVFTPLFTQTRKMILAK